MHPNVHTSTIYNSQGLNATLVPISKWVDQKTMVHLHNGILCSREKEGTPTLWDNMGGTGEHYANWSKTGGKGQTPYDLTFNWNICNQQKEKCKQNITRDIEIKNNLTIARGEEEGTEGRRVFRNYYKIHMDKTKGEGESKGGRWVWLWWGKVVGRKCRQL